MLTLNNNQQRLPLGGHHFPEEGLTIRGETFDEVVKKLKDFRINNGRPEGNPKADVLNFYLREFPWMVRYDSQPEAPTGQNPEYVKWRSWVARTWKNPPLSLLTTKEAGERWDKCKECPFNQKMDWADGDESYQYEGRAFLLRQGRDVPVSVGYCSCHNWDIGVASFLSSPEKFSSISDEKKPEFCWG